MISSVPAFDGGVPRRAEQHRLEFAGKLRLGSAQNTGCALQV